MRNGHRGERGRPVTGTVERAGGPEAVIVCPLKDTLRTVALEPVLRSHRAMLGRVVNGHRGVNTAVVTVTVAMDSRLAPGCVRDLESVRMRHASAPGRIVRTCNAA